MRLTAQQIADELDTDMNTAMRGGASYAVANAGSDFDDDYPSPDAHCTTCGALGHVGTCYTAVPFIHEVMDTESTVGAENLMRWCIDTAVYPYAIYCGYGSRFDGFFLLLTSKQEKRLPAKVCSKCLTKALRHEHVPAVDYFGLFSEYPSWLLLKHLM